MTNVMRSEAMAEKAISVRLDAEAQRALELLMREGVSQSDAIRSALIAASRARLGRSSGHLAAADLRDVDDALKLLLGLL